MDDAVRRVSDWIIRQPKGIPSTMVWCVHCNFGLRQDQEERLESLIRNSVSLRPPERFEIHFFNTLDDGNRHRNMCVTVNPDA